ncbi:hypothetical protein HOE52_03940 [Candidatus Woesearchaeota archaeon]|nr:hypothetical protein [Candidatus Woesearchaeota archaeon]
MVKSIIKKNSRKSSSRTSSKKQNSRSVRSKNAVSSTSKGSIFNLLSHKVWMIIAIAVIILVLGTLTVVLFQGDTLAGQATGTIEETKIYISDLDSGDPFYFAFLDFGKADLFKIKETNVNKGEFEISYVHSPTIYKTDKLIGTDVYCSYGKPNSWETSSSFTCSNKPCIIGIQSGETHQRCLVINTAPSNKFIQVSVAGRSQYFTNLGSDTSSSWSMEFPSVTHDSYPDGLSLVKANLVYLKGEKDAKNLLESGGCTSALNIGDVIKYGAGYQGSFGQGICVTNPLNNNVFSFDTCKDKSDPYKLTSVDSDFFEFHRDALCMPLGGDKVKGVIQETNVLGWVECDASKNPDKFNPKTDQALVAGPGILSEDKTIKPFLKLQSGDLNTAVDELAPSKKTSEDLAQHFLCARAGNNPEGRSTWHVCLDHVNTGSGLDTILLNPKLSSENINKRGFGWYMDDASNSETIPLAGITYTCTKEGWVDKAKVETSKVDNSEVVDPPAPTKEDPEVEYCPVGTVKQVDGKPQACIQGKFSTTGFITIPLISKVTCDADNMGPTDTDYNFICGNTKGIADEFIWKVCDTKKAYNGGKSGFLKEGDKNIAFYYADKWAETQDGKTYTCTDKGWTTPVVLPPKSAEEILNEGCTSSTSGTIIMSGRADVLCSNNKNVECDAKGDGNFVSDKKYSLENVGIYSSPQFLCERNVIGSDTFESWYQCGGTKKEKGILKQSGDVFTIGDHSYTCSNNVWVKSSVIKLGQVTPGDTVVSIADVSLVVDHIIGEKQLSSNQLKAANVVGCKDNPQANDITIDDVLAIVDAILDGETSLTCVQ